MKGIKYVVAYNPAKDKFEALCEGTRKPLSIEAQKKEDAMSMADAAGYILTGEY